MQKSPTIAQLRNGPPAVGLMTAAAALGLGRTKAYDLARREEFPVKVKRIGGSYRVLVVDLLQFLGISETVPPPRPPLAAPARHVTATRPY